METCSQVRMDCVRGRKVLGVWQGQERGRVGTQTRGNRGGRPGLKAQDPGILGVFIGVGAGWAASPTPTPVLHTHALQGYGADEGIGEGESAIVVELEVLWA